jgi:U3 small nucleolar RNA-associated protein MPP10
LAQENENNDDDEDIDFFGDIPDSDEEEIAYHDDFFDKKQKSNFPSRKGGKRDKKEKEEEETDNELNEDDYDDGMKSAMNDLFDEEDAVKEEEEDEAQKQRESERNLSSFERQQLKIQREIQQLEKEAIAEKKWALKGEVKAKDRPSDALLTEDLEFERTAKPVPVITQEVTETLEDLIRRRIKEDNFDDLPRRIITDVTNFRPSSNFELSEAKSSKSLAELYEDDYKGTETTNAVSEELQKNYDEIKDLFQSISHKLDALSSAHFIPKPVQKSIDIKVNAPTISMEDAQPLTASAASTLAPQEVYKASRSGNENEISLKSGAVVARDELTREDKQRLRRANKRKRSKDFKAKEQSVHKKSKKQDAIDTLSKASNVTIIGSKGEMTDVTGALKKDKVKQGTSSLKL